VLEDHADGTAERAQAALVQRADIDAIHHHLAGCRPLQPVDQADHGGFAGTRTADDAGDAAARDDEIHSGKRGEGRLFAIAAKGFRHCLEGHHRVGCRGRDRTLCVLTDIGIHAIALEEIVSSFRRAARQATTVHAAIRHIRQ